MAHNDIQAARTTYDGMIRWAKIATVVIAIVVGLVMMLIA